MTSLLRKSAAATAGAAMVALAFAVATPFSDAQEAPAAKSKAKTQKKAPAKGTADAPDAAPPAASPKVSRRVPMYFGGLGLSDAQKESIYALGADYQPRIQDLERQADALRAELMAECEEVLTAPQRKALAETRKSAADRRKSTAGRKAEAKADADADADADAEPLSPAPKAKGAPATRPTVTID